MVELLLVDDPHRARVKTGFKAFPDWHETIEDIIAEGDKVWVLPHATGTHTSEFMGLAPTGKKITAMNVDIYRIANGKPATMLTFIYAHAPTKGKVG